MCYRPRVLSGYDRIFVQETHLKWQFGGHGGGGGEGANECFRKHIYKKYCRIF